MKLDARKVGLAVTLIAITAGSWWLTRLTTAPETVASGKERHDPDYIVENFHTTVMTAQGRPQYELRGKLLTHYGDDGSSTIEQPYLIQYNPGRAPTHIRAREGYLPNEFERIQFTGDVHMAQGRDPHTGGADIRTQKLMIELEKPKKKAPSS